MTSDEDDYFGINIVQKTPVPQHLLKLKSSEFFDEAFFPGLSDESPEHLETAEDYQPVNVFEEQTATDLSQLIEANATRSQAKTRKPARAVAAPPVISDGLDELLAEIEPVWTYSQEQLVELMARRVIFETEDLIAFDKPYQMAYSGAKKDQAQLDRLLQDLRKKVAPDTDRLHLVASVDKCCSGIVLFAKNTRKQAEMRQALAEGTVQQRFRCLVKGVPKVKEAVISIPLVKQMKERDVKYCAVTEETHDKKKLVLAKSHYKLLNWNNSAYTSVIDVAVTNPSPSVVHQVRSHLYFGLNCPLVGDKKYSEGANYLPPRLSPNFMHCIGASPTTNRKLPILMTEQKRYILIGQSTSCSMRECRMPYRTALFLTLIDRVEWSVRRRWQDRLCGGLRVPSHNSILLEVRLKPNFEYHIDKAWSERVLQLLQKSLHLEKTMWELSTLGGALSAMGDFIDEFADRAFAVSVGQRRIAEELGDPEMVARCNMYIALSLAQKGHFKLSKKIIRREYQTGLALNSKLIKNCSQGLWTKITFAERTASFTTKQQNRSLACC